MTNQKEPMTMGQLNLITFKIAGAISNLLYKKGFGFVDASYHILSDEKEIEKITEEVCVKVLSVKVDEWIEEKKRIERFYKKFFNRTIDWSKISVPPKKEGMNKLGVSLLGVTYSEIRAVYVKHFSQDSFLEACSPESVSDQQRRPNSDYAFSYVDEDRAGTLGESYGEVVKDDNKLMTPKEALITAFRHRVENRKVITTGLRYVDF